LHNNFFFLLFIFRKHEMFNIPIRLYVSRYTYFYFKLKHNYLFEFQVFKNRWTLFFLWFPFRCVLMPRYIRYKMIVYTFNLYYRVETAVIVGGYAKSTHFSALNCSSVFYSSADDSIILCMYLKSNKK